MMLGKAEGEGYPPLYS